MTRFYKDLFLNHRLFLVLAVCTLGFVVSYFIELLFPLFQTLLAAAILLLFSDIMILFNSSMKLQCQRSLPKLLSLGDNNTISVSIGNPTGIKVNGFLIDELPEQLQIRTFRIPIEIPPGSERTYEYNINPNTRGDYKFGNLHCLVVSFIGFVSRRLTYNFDKVVPCYPSLIQMNRYDLKNLSKISRIQGIKKIRRIGHSYEFDQIKKYVHGDDYRSINWKATSRTAELMVNHYEDEKAQQVYCLVDSGRAMNMPFNNMSLLDYAINSVLVIANTVLKKHDKVGIICFSDKEGINVKAGRNRNQLRNILDSLYAIIEKNIESDFDNLYHRLRNMVRARSLLILFTNFESIQSMRRVLPILRKINRTHLLVVVFFENVPVLSYSRQQSATIEEVYYRTMAKSFVYEKRLIVRELENFGIQTILCKPDELSVSTINKYLELKSRGLI